MKRLLTLMLVLGAIAFAAHAGPYFEVENVGLVLEPSLVVGVDFDAPFVNWSNMSIWGDFYIVNDNLAVYPTPWIGGYDLGFVFTSPEGHDFLEVCFGMDVEVAPLPWPDYVELESWTTSVGIWGYPGDVVTVYGLLDMEYDIDPGPGPDVGVWDLVPTIGIEVHWP